MNSGRMSTFLLAILPATYFWFKPKSSEEFHSWCFSSRDFKSRESKDYFVHYRICNSHHTAWHKVFVHACVCWHWEGWYCGWKGRKLADLPSIETSNDEKIPWYLSALKLSCALKNHTDHVTMQVPIGIWNLWWGLQLEFCIANEGYQNMPPPKYATLA